MERGVQFLSGITRRSGVGAACFVSAQTCLSFSLSFSAFAAAEAINDLYERRLSLFPATAGCGSILPPSPLSKGWYTGSKDGLKDDSAKPHLKALHPVMTMVRGPTTNETLMGVVPPLTRGTLPEGPSFAGPRRRRRTSYGASPNNGPAPGASGSPEAGDNRRHHAPLSLFLVLKSCRTFNYISACSCTTYYVGPLHAA